MIYILFIIGFVLLIKGADLLVDGASSLAKKMGISAMMIGLTVVAFGTSMPELVVNLMASLSGSTEIAIGNIVGSNIANILLILGVTAIIYPLTVKSNTVWKEIPLSFLAAILVWVMANDVLLDVAGANFLTRIDGIILICFFIIFLYYTFGLAKSEDGSSDEGEEIKIETRGKSIFKILVGLGFLVVGGKWIVEGAISIAQLFNMSERVIGLTVVAIGTSLPELATSIVAAMKKQSDIAIGNVVGSNIFNIFWILGVSAFISPLPFSKANSLDLYVLFVASMALFLALFIGKKHLLEKWQGVLFVLAYAIYVSILIFINMILKIKKLSPEAKLPTYAHPGDVGMDMYSMEDYELKPGERKIFPVGFALEFDNGYAAIVKDKSSLPMKYGIHTMGGVFDAGYRGEYNVNLINLGSESYKISKGDKIAQLVIYPIVIAELEEVNEMSETSRGTGAFGSTGK